MQSDVTAALEVDRVVVRFRDAVALNQLSLRAARGQITAVLGPNGAGKTTLMRCSTGLVTPSSGSISVLGNAPGSATATTHVGWMPQSTGAWSGIKPAELLHYLASLYAQPLEVAALITRLGIGAYASTPYRRLSGGQQQAVNLAGALIGRPSLVFLDEPTSGMDPHARRSTWELIRALRTDGVSVVLTTHGMDEAEALADQVYIVDRGSVTIAGSVPDLTADGVTLEEVFLANTTASVPQ